MRELNDLQRRFDGYVPQMLEARHSYAVLCPFVEQPDGLHLLFEVRAATLRRQPGEVCFPGGMQEPGETPEVCALRETWEETGLTLTDYRYRGLVTFVSDEAPTEYMHLFTATGWTGRIREDCDEGVLGWIHRDRLAALPQWEGDRIFLELLRREVPFFSLKLRYEGERLAYAALNGREMER